jgi:hypothetical protein
MQEITHVIFYIPGINSELTLTVQVLSLLLLLLLLLLFVTFIQSTYNYILVLETNHVSWIENVATIL